MGTSLRWVRYGWCRLFHWTDVYTGDRPELTRRRICRRCQPEEWAVLLRALEGPMAAVAEVLNAMSAAPVPAFTHLHHTVAAAADAMAQAFAEYAKSQTKEPPHADR